MRSVRSSADCPGLWVGVGNRAREQLESVQDEDPLLPSLRDGSRPHSREVAPILSLIQGLAHIAAVQGLPVPVWKERWLWVWLGELRQRPSGAAN